MSKNNSKPVYLSSNKYPTLSNENPLLGENVRDPEICEENEPQMQSCMPQLNNKGKLTNFWLCFILGTIIELLSFLSHADNFILWFIMGEILLFSGILFFAKISEQIKHLKERKRKETALLFFAGTGMIFFFRLILGWTIIALISCLATLIVYLLYARTYIVELNKLLKKYFKIIGFFD